MSNRTFTFDADLQLKDAGLVAATDEAQVDGADQILDLGPGRVDAIAVCDVSAIEIASNDERYDLVIQGSTRDDFADTIVDLASLPLGANETLEGDQDSVVGRYELPFSTEYLGTIYRYVRLHIVVAGTIATGINLTAFVAKRGEGAR